MKDTDTYGFAKSDAEALLPLIELRDEVIQGQLPSRRRGGSSTGATLYRLTLNASLATGTADADILNMDGSDTGLDEDVLDPLGIFASLVNVDDAGLCLLQNGSYYVIQAPCPSP
jgi:hypothetical protein